jgi:hypothetical protein
MPVTEEGKMSWLPFGGRTRKEFDETVEAIETGAPYPWWTEEQKQRYKRENTDGDDTRSKSKKESSRDT